MQDRLEALERAFRDALREAADVPAAVEAVRVRFLGKKGELTALLKSVGALQAALRPAAGAAINAARDRLEAALGEAAGSARSAAETASVDASMIDVSLPPRTFPHGAIHPVTATRRDLEAIFRSMGFTVEIGPEVEDDRHNFEALNIPKDHPARDATDTFYLPGGLLLRTHTSPVQIRTMEALAPPIRMICPGRVYRKDLDATHLPMFHQLEALVVDEGISLADLKGTCAAVWSRFFGASVAIRLRPGYFPFVEPGFELDARCPFCATGCSVCKQSTWIELLPCGMVHPNVLKAGGVDPEVWTGFAFGLGLSRLVMLRYGIDDVRLLLSGDVRFLERSA